MSFNRDMLQGMLKKQNSKYAPAGERKYSVVPTGLLALDKAIGVQDSETGEYGLPRGRIIEVAGEFSCGKTTLALQIIANAQKQGMSAAFMDCEGTLDFAYAHSLGVDTEDPNLWYYQIPEFIEDLTEEARTIVAGKILVGKEKKAKYTEGYKSPDIFVLDSVPAAITREMDEGNMGNKPAWHAAPFGKFTRMFNGWLSHSNTVAIFINQIRDNIDFMAARQGKTKYISGGSTLEFYKSISLWLQDSSKIKEVRENLLTSEEEDTIIANYVWMHIVKDKCTGNKDRKVRLTMRRGLGFDNLQTFIDLGVGKGVLKISGGGYVQFKEEGEEGYWKERIGKDNVRAHLIDNPDKIDLLVGELGI